MKENKQKEREFKKYFKKLSYAEQKWVLNRLKEHHLEPAYKVK